MFIVQTYSLAVIFSIITMLCWGSWANTQKLAGREWRFELFYWDYVIGLLILSLILAFTLGSFGVEGRSFIQDLGQVNLNNLLWAFFGGVVFNAANILLVAAIAIAGMSVAFPVGVGLALVIGVFLNYLLNPVANPVFLSLGVAFVAIAIILDGIAYKRLPSEGRGMTTKGLVLCLFSGILMGLWYPIWAKSISTDFVNLAVGKLSPYTAVFLLSIGVLVSNFLFNTLAMKKPFIGEPVSGSAYFKGGLRLHSIGILGGIIWCIGTSLNIIAAGRASFAVSYGLGQTAPMIGALWGIFAWKEFKGAPPGTNKFLSFMFACFIIGLVFIIIARVM